MLIAQLSDTHIRAHGELYQGVCDSSQRLADAINHLEHLDQKPDLVVLTGEITDHGQAAEYAQAHRILAKLTVPYLVLPGNHDSRDALRAGFADHAYLPASGPLHYCIDTYPVRIVALDTSIPGHDHGALDDDALHWLQTTLLAERSKPTLVMLHHPPFLSGITYLDAYRLHRPQALERMLESVDNVELVVCGHVHRAMVRRFGGTVVAACPSTAMEIALQLAPNATGEAYLTPPQGMMHRWETTEGMVSHVLSLGPSPRAYPFG